MEQPPGDNPRRRSQPPVAKSRKRSLSQASIQSAGPQRQSYNGSQSQGIEGTAQMTPEDMVMHSAAQLQNPGAYEIDPSLGAQALSYPQDMQYRTENGHPVSFEGYSTNYGEADSQLMESRSDEQDDVESMAGAVKGKKTGKSSAANEVEMRELFNSNKHRHLSEVAIELHGNERGPQSERQRQVFAMLWINQVCEKSNGSVPRGRVYSAYVTRCTNERVTVLNPASFGKLVRVLYPGLKTRRLGVRGESKYHYVGFTIKENELDMAEQNDTPQLNQPDLTQNMSMLAQTEFPADRAVFPPVVQEPQPKHGLIKSHSVYQQPQIDVNSLDATSTKMPMRLRIPPAHNTVIDNDPIQLPKIEPFLPAGTDPDSANALYALYRSHCTSVIECMRYCKTKTFFHLFSSFHGTLTMPVQKLFTKPEIAPWIEECDFVMYQKIMRMTGPAANQVVPRFILAFWNSISEKLTAHIQACFQGQPQHVIDAKVAPAILFTSLLDRVQRVNGSAHAAAEVIKLPQNRNLMYEDWITMARTRKVAECVPTRAMDDVVTLLLTELRSLVDPVDFPWEVEELTPYGVMSLRTGFEQSSVQDDAEHVLDRWVDFLHSLPEKFPYAKPAEIIYFVERVGNQVLRDITYKGGASFTAWWAFKCWIDEMIAFMAEQGGFLEAKTSRTNKGDAASLSGSRTSEHGSRYSSASEDFLREATNVDVSRPMDITIQAAMNVVAGLDDSGISMRPEDEFTMSKFSFQDTQTNGMGSVSQPV